MSIGSAIGSSIGSAIGSALVGGGAGVVLPEGYDGLWYATDYVSSPRKQIPNAVDPQTSANLLGAPKRLFSNTDLYQKSGTTVTDDAVADPDGATEASTFNGTGNWRVGPAPSSTFAAGTYTIAINAKRNAGTDQQFSFSVDNLATRTAANTATSSWQRFSYTFTKGASWNGNTLYVCSIDGATAANIAVCNFDLYSGSSDLGPESLVGTMALGVSNVASVPSVTGGAIDFSSGGVGIVQYPANVTGTARTVCAVVSKTAAGTTFQGVLSKIQNYQHFTAMTDQGNNGQVQYAGGTHTLNAAGLWRLLNRGYHLISVVASASGTRVYLDKALLFSDSTAMGSQTMRDFWVSAVNTYALTSGLKMQAMATWPSALTQAQIATAYDHFAGNITTAMDTTTRVYVAEGDSITEATGSYAYLFGANASPAVIGSNKAVSGSTLASLNSRAATVDLAIASTAQDHILSVLIGANDLAGYSGGAAQYITDLAAYCDARRAAGWQVVICTILPTTNATHNTRRATVNAAIAGWVGVHADAIADFAANGTMGDDADASNLTYYSDGVHPTAAGQAVLEPILRAAINAL